MSAHPAPAIPQAAMPGNKKACVVVGHLCPPANAGKQVAPWGFVMKGKVWAVGRRGGAGGGGVVGKPRNHVMPLKEEGMAVFHAWFNQK